MDLFSLHQKPTQTLARTTLECVAQSKKEPTKKGGCVCQIELDFWLALLTADSFCPMQLWLPSTVARETQRLGHNRVSAVPT